MQIKSSGKHTIRNENNVSCTLEVIYGIIRSMESFHTHIIVMDWLRVALRGPFG